MMNKEIKLNIATFYIRKMLVMDDKLDRRTAVSKANVQQMLST